jgi:hypothetical protein
VSKIEIKSMTVKELIELLKQENQELPVVVWHYGAYYNNLTVRHLTNSKLLPWATDAVEIEYPMSAGWPY